jgi:hypothetical protein
MILYLAIAQSTTIVRADILNTVDLAINQGNDNETLIDLGREGDIGNKLLNRTNEMIHRTYWFLIKGDCRILSRICHSLISRLRQIVEIYSKTASPSRTVELDEQWLHPVRYERTRW